MEERVPPKGANDEVARLGDWLRGHADDPGSADDLECLQLAFRSDNSRDAWATLARRLGVPQKRATRKLTMQELATDVKADLMQKIRRKMEAPAAAGAAASDAESGGAERPPNKAPPSDEEGPAHVDDVGGWLALKPDRVPFRDLQAQWARAHAPDANKTCLLYTSDAADE